MKNLFFILLLLGARSGYSQDSIVNVNRQFLTTSRLLSVCFPGQEVHEVSVGSVVGLLQWSGEQISLSWSQVVEGDTLNHTRTIHRSGRTYVRIQNNRGVIISDAVYKDANSDGDAVVDMAIEAERTSVVGTIRRAMHSAGCPLRKPK